MESDKQTTERQLWTSCKLIIDPALTKGLYKVYRYDGLYFNIPVEDLGLFPVDTVRDPRICRLWSKSNKTELLVPKFKVDEWYVGPVPPKEVTFSRLNDNIKEDFLTNMCREYGNIEEVEIFYNLKNKKHLGIAKVVFDTVRAAKAAVQHLHQMSVMGNAIHVELDPKGENRGRYLQLLLHGLYTPWTLPVGSSEQALQSLIDNFLGSTATQRQGSISSPTSIATPLSLDTAYSSIWQDTPSSFRLTPCSQGTPRTPGLSATPLSQDSCYSSLQATPVLQWEPSTCSVHKPLRRELGPRKAARSHWRSAGVSDVSLILKHCQAQAPHALSNHITQTSSQQHEVHGEQSSANNTSEASFELASPCQGSRHTVTAASTTLPLKCNSVSILSINFTADRQRAVSSPFDKQACLKDLSPSAASCSSSPQPEGESLDSRIENLLINSQTTDFSCLDRRTLGPGVHSQDSPTSPCPAHNSPFTENSVVCSLMTSGAVTGRNQQSNNDQVHVSQTSLSENEDDETTQAVMFLKRSSESPTLSDPTHFEWRAHTHVEKDAERFQSLAAKEHHVADEDAEQSHQRQSGAMTPTPDKSFLPQSLSFSSQHLTPNTPAITAGTHPPVTCLPFPIPPLPLSLPPVPPRLPNGTIPIPPPNWIPPPGHHISIHIPPPPIPPPPSIPPPLTFLGPPPPLMVPPALPPVHTYPLPIQPPGHLDKGNPPTHGSAPVPFPRPPWPGPPFPRFNPFMPPPDYTNVQDNPYKVTAEKVLQVLIDELKSIIKKDIARRMIEGVAFKLFEDWWDCQEKKTKTQVLLLKSGPEIVGDEKKQINNVLSHISCHGKKPPLPSFKVKRKQTNDPAASKETENVLSSTNENPDVAQASDTVTPAYERPKRRHARPHVLDSDDDVDDDVEGKEAEKPVQDKEMMSDKVGAVVTDDSATQNLCDRYENEDDDDSIYPDEDNEVARNHTVDEEKVVSHNSDGVQLDDDETLLESSSSGESEYSSDFDSSDSFSSDSFEDSSYSNLSHEDEDMEEEEDDEDTRSNKCVVISSDEESMEHEPPLIAAAPLTPGAHLDLCIQDWSSPDQYTTCQQDICDLDVLLRLQPREPQDLQPPSPLAVEPDLVVEMEISEWMVESPETPENLRPLTPTGCLVDSDPDLLIKSKPASPAVEEVERPQTPGKGIVADVESEDSDVASDVLSPFPVSSELVEAPPDLPAALYILYPDRPKTPGREERGGRLHHSSGRAPTPGRDITMSQGSAVMCPSLSSPPPIPSLSGNPYIAAPKTPGRDIILPRRAVVHRRKRQHLLHDSCHGCSPVIMSSPCSLSQSTSDIADERSVCLKKKPLQGLENMPNLFDEEKSLLRQKQWRRLKRRWRTHHRQRSRKRITASLSYYSYPHRWRSRHEDRRILHSVWKEGLDEEDAGLLQYTYERLQEQDNGFGWLSDTLWIPHPPTKILTEQSEEHKSWQPKHRTGSARSEGFYKISKKDKMKFVNSTQTPIDLPSTSTQGTSIPAQQPTFLLRSGSDFRAEQRRLLSSFSCDSDLLKFNQLKFRKKRICFSRSHIHEWGLFAMEPIAADEMVIEYVGQIIRQVIADMREQRYEEEGIGSSYLFRVDHATIIDATKCGNLARFVNHSCNPNCYAKIITVESQKKIVLYSRQPISINEEITYDYKFPIEDTKIPCLCGADSCRGSLN